MWTVLKAADDWAAYKAGVCRETNKPNGFFAWSPGPLDYPCLVDTLIPRVYQVGGASATVTGVPPQQIKLHTAFVYAADVALLATATDPAPAGPPVDRQQARFNLWVTAQLLAVSHYLTKSGLCVPLGGLEANQEAFEGTLEEMLTRVQMLHEDMTAHERALLRASR